MCVRVNVFNSILELTIIIIAHCELPEEPNWCTFNKIDRHECVNILLITKHILVTSNNDDDDDYDDKL